MSVSKRNKIIIGLFIFCFSLIIHRWQAISVYDHGFGKSWFNGDAFSSRNVISASKYFVDSGFCKTKLLPVFDYKTNYPNGYSVDIPYTHYPPLADVTAGVFAKVFNTSNRNTLGVLPLLFSIGLFFLILKTLNLWIKNDRIALISAAILWLSNYFIAWADDLHQHVYVEFFRWLFCYLITIYYSSNTTNKIQVFLLAIIYLILSLLSFEPIVFIAIVIIGFSLLNKKPLFSWVNFILLSMPILGFGLHLYQNYLFFGNWQLVYKDFHDAFLIRSVGAVDIPGGDYWTNRSLGIGEIPRLIVLWIQRLGHFYIIPGSMFLMMAFFAMKKLKKENLNLFYIALILFLAGISWNFIMAKHAMIHMFTVRHMAIFYGLIIGFGMLEYIQYYKMLLNQKKWIWISLNSLFIAYSIGLILINHFYFLYLKYGFLYPYLGTDTFQFAKIADYLI